LRKVSFKKLILEKRYVRLAKRAKYGPYPKERKGENLK